VADTQLVGEALDRRLVGAGVAEEDVVAGHALVYLWLGSILVGATTFRLSSQGGRTGMASPPPSAWSPSSPPGSPPTKRAGSIRSLLCGRSERARRSRVSSQRVCVLCRSDRERRGRLMSRPAETCDAGVRATIALISRNLPRNSRSAPQNSRFSPRNSRSEPLLREVCRVLRECSHEKHEVRSSLREICHAIREARP
jgi:hypothetical protein